MKRSICTIVIIILLATAGGFGALLLKSGINLAQAALLQRDLTGLRVAAAADWQRNIKRSQRKVPDAAPQPQPAPRIPYTAAEDAISVIPGIPDARFWADSEKAFNEALPRPPGAWLILSSGGEDGAFGAGLLNGLSISGKRPDYALVTGVSTGALMAPFVFAGPQFDPALRRAYTKITAADVFEVGGTGESFVGSWPLKDTIAREITPELLRAIASEHQRGRRLLVVTTNLDSERSVVWNMGAIATHGEQALNLFANVLLASASVPGAFPPVLINVDAKGKHFAEMHVDGGLGGQLFIAPAALMAPTSDHLLPASQLYIVVNTGLERDFQVVERFAPSILAQSVGMAVKVDTRMMLDRAYLVAKHSNVGFNVATIPAAFHAPSRGPFDPKYMGALFRTGFEQGQSTNPFDNRPPPYSQ
jgi:predicted acylesterase/phospholipase RssA